MNILITGGAGYVGNAVVQRLAKIEAVTQITVYDNLANGRHTLLQKVTNSPKVHFVEGDILDNRKLKTALQEADVVVHLATVHHAEHHYMEQVNHWGTANLINLMEEVHVKRFLFLSSQEVYGDGETNIDSPLLPKTPYAKSMQRAEKYVSTLFEKCETAIIRTAEVFGYNPAMHFNHGINKHIFDAKYRKMLHLNGDGLHRTAAIHVDDLAQLISHLTVQTPTQKHYNATTMSYIEMEIFELLQSSYPTLEATFTSHHLRLPDAFAKTDDFTENLLKKQKTIAEAALEVVAHTNL